MTNLTPEKRAEWRMAASGPSHGVNINSRVLLALLKAADERDRLAEVEDRLSVLLWRLTNGRLSKTGYPVEFMEQEIEENLAAYHETTTTTEEPS